jgi:hypothetical protein
VWRFGRDFRHLINEGNMDGFHPRNTVMNLERAQIRPDPGIKKSTEVVTSR